ncbi:MAG TPA: VOC family protein [Burkholderiaceae bacterium]|nr:VOC family protein [Burkholderiaceae bacterium]
MATPQGSFVWYELMTTDPDAAAAFYAKVVGWNVADAGMPGMKYTLVKAGADSVGGIMALPDSAKAMGAGPAWDGYIAVADVDAAAARAAAAGASIYKAPEDIPGVGRFAVLGDPHGASFMLFRGTPGDEPPPAAGPDAPGHVGWHELHAGDGVAAFDFYAAQFGWEKRDAMDMGPAGVYQLFGLAGSDKQSAIGGMMTKMAQTPRPHWLYYFIVDAIDAAVGRIDAAGGKVVNGPMEVPGGSWIVNAVDPQGAMFALVAPKR